MSDQTLRDATPHWRRRLKWPSEGFILSTLFRGLLAATIGFLALDYSRLVERGAEPLPGIVEREEPMVMTPPRPSDHVRPYLPRTTPRLMRGKPPEMPGYVQPVPHARVGEAMTFRRGPNSAASAVGRIEIGTALEFAQFIDGQGGEIKSLHLHSPGGSVQDALAMSSLIRDKALRTVVPEGGYCASSCPIVLAGGVERDIAAKSWVGVHQVFSPAGQPGDLATGLAQGQSISANVQQHLVDMGVKPEAWLHAMRTPSDQLYVFTPKELVDLKLATALTSG